VNADLPDDFPDDLLGDITSSEPGLDLLLGHLTRSATPDELAGESSALAMFRANGPQAAATPNPQAVTTPLALTPGPQTAFTPGPRAPAPDPSRWPARRARRLTAVVALAAAAGLIVTAYAAALPRPLQNAAYHVLGFAGVPHNRPARPSAPAAGSPAPSPAHGSPPAATARPRSTAPASPQPSSASPRPGSGPAILTVTIASRHLPSGANEVFVGTLTDHGQAVAGASLTLQERTAHQPTWSVAGQAMTGQNGRAEVTVPDLTASAAFRLTGPGGILSQPVLVIAVPQVAATVSPGRRGQPETVIATSPLADPGDTVVLQVLSSLAWKAVQTSKLDGDRQAQFMLRAGLRPSAYRVVLLPTGVHGFSVSNTIGPS
jgi:hypothetical protein